MIENSTKVFQKCSGFCVQGGRLTMDGAISVQDGHLLFEQLCSNDAESINIGGDSNTNYAMNLDYKF